MAKFLSGDLTAAEKLETIFPESADTSRLLVAVHPADYSASAIAKAVEDCDVQLLGLTVTAMRTRGGRHVVLLRVAAADTRSLERSLERYGFRVEYAQERTGFAPYGNDDPPVIRIVAVKPEQAVEG